MLARLALIATALVLAVAVPAAPAFADFTDVPKDYWAYDAIMDVASTNTWMQDYGPDTFQPATKETREFLARTLVEIWAPDEPIDPTITFDDLPPDDPFYPFANVAVKLTWLHKKNGNFNPLNTVKSRKFDRALVLALGLQAPMDGLDAIHQDDGTAYDTPKNFGAMQLARWLGLHYNHSDDSLDIGKNARVPRDEVAWSIDTAVNLEQWQLDDAAAKFDAISLPAVDATQQSFTQYMINEIGPPYVWGGEWDKASPPGYCCGDQPRGGYDCSGWVWWTLKKNEDGYDAAQFHPDYNGWHLAERVSSDMAAKTTDKLTFDELGPGNLMFFASDGGSQADDVDHVGIYLGNGWMFHSTSGGPFIEWVADGWYFDHFVWGRQLKANSSPQRSPMLSPDVGEPAVGP